MVKGTGPDARITGKDIDTFVVSGPPPPAVAVAAAAAPAMPPPGVPAAAYEDIPLGNIRAVSYTTGTYHMVANHLGFNRRISDIVDSQNIVDFINFISSL